ncbi:MAG TPA: recombinase family protein [Verrucomicrobiae bacterium]|jgi:DNA invertase Pin-like site-specific DNA recombinase|nr:recombinase family protein [Verrucomicrobiae bacterium]
MTTNSPPAAICLGYIRVSTDRQELSVDAQSETIRRYSTAYQLPEPIIFAEANASGASVFAERKEGKRLVAVAHEALAANRSVTMIIPKVDRLGRDTIDVSQTVKLFHSLKVRMVFLDIGCDTTTPMGMAFLQIAAIFAQLELARIHERIAAGFEEKRSKGELCGTVPYGWDAVETGEARPKGKHTVNIRKLVDNLEEQKWILYMVQLRNAGWGYHSIAKNLNAHNVPTKHGRGDIIKYKGETRFNTGKWQSGNVAKIINSKTVKDWLATRVAVAA